MSLKAVLSIRIAADPDSPFHFHADPDPTFHSDADPDPSFTPSPNPTTHFFPNLDPSMLQNVPLRLPAFHFDVDADPDPVFHCDADLDPDPKIPLFSTTHSLSFQRIFFLPSFSQLYYLKRSSVNHMYVLLCKKPELGFLNNLWGNRV